MFFQTELFISTHISFVLFSPGSAEAEVGWGRHLNGHLTASCFRNILTKNYWNLIILLQVTIDNVGDVFWDTVSFSEVCQPFFLLLFLLYFLSYFLFLCDWSAGTQWRFSIGLCMKQVKNMTLRHIYMTTDAKEADNNHHFYPRQLYRQVLLRARISYGNSVRLSVRLSWCHDPVPNQAQVS